jgi:transcriptional regulator with XRE-family HTH domain
VFYAQLEKLCKEKGIGMTVLVSEMGMSKGNLSNWRNGGYPSAEILIKLADRLETTVDYLLGRTDKPEINR